MLLQFIIIYILGDGRMNDLNGDGYMKDIGDNLIGK